MSTIVARVHTDDQNNSYFVQKNNQNNLKGLLWGTGGAVLTGTSLSLTAATVGIVTATALSSAGILVNDNLRNSAFGTSVPAMIAFAAAAVIVDSFALKFTGYCFNNAIHHLGPEFQIVKA